MDLRLLVAFVSVALQDPAPRALRELTLEAAFRTAREEDKLVLVAFVRASTPETKVMDQLTWSDPAVVKWIEEHMVALAVDLERQPELATRYAIVDTPATVYFAASGEELDRLVGVTQADMVLRTGRMLGRCGDALALARKSLAASPEDPTRHVELAHAYLSCQRFDRAREELLWCWDHAAGVASFTSIRRDVLPSEIAALDKLERTDKPGKPGRSLLAQRRDALRARLFEWKEGDPHLELALDLAALNTGIGADEKARETWDTARADERAPPAVVEALFTDRVVAQLYREQRYADLLVGRGDPLVYLDRRLGRVAEQVLALQASGGDPAELEVERNGALAHASLYFEALCALDRLDEARDLTRMITTYDPRMQGYIALIPAADRAGRTQLANELVELALAAPADAAEKERLRRFLERRRSEAK